MLAFLDADDIFLPDKLTRQVGLLHEHADAVMVYGNTEYWVSWNPDRPVLKRDRLGRLGVATGRAYPPPRLLEAWLRKPGIVPCICSLLARRAAAVACGGFDESIQDMYEDQVFLAKMVLAGPVLVEPGCGERYRQHAGSTSARAIEDQRYHPTRPNESRRAFLQWLAGYVARHPAAVATSCMQRSALRVGLERPAIAPAGARRRSQATAVRTISRRSVKAGVHPRVARARAASATSTAGSPGRRSARSSGTRRPVSASTAATTSSTECPWPVPRFERGARATRDQVLQRADVGVGEIAHVHVVPDRRAIRRRVVGAEHLESRQPPQCSLDRERNGVRLGLVTFADLAVRVRARGVEVAQGDGLQPMRPVEVGEDALDHQLARAVGIDRRLRMVFVDRHPVRDAVRRAGAREHEPADPCVAQRLEQRERAEHVVVVVATGLGDRFADVGIRGEVHDRLGPVPAQDGVERIPIARVGHFERAPRQVAQAGAFQVIEADGLQAAARECLARVAADVAGRAGDEHLHDGPGSRAPLDSNSSK